MSVDGRWGLSHVLNYCLYSIVVFVVIVILFYLINYLIYLFLSSMYNVLPDFSIECMFTSFLSEHLFLPNLFLLSHETSWFEAIHPRSEPVLQRLVLFILTCSSCPLILLLTHFYHSIHLLSHFTTSSHPCILSSSVSSYTAFFCCTIS